MIKKHSDDPDVAAAAARAARIIAQTLRMIPSATTFDYGGHVLKLGEYNVCERCTRPIAEAQQASRALIATAASTEDGTTREHLELAAEYLKLEAATAEVRAELHNGHGSEPIINALLGFVHDRSLHDQYDHSHHQGN